VNIKEIQQKGITKIRLNKWANPDAHITLYKTDDGHYGPWATLSSVWLRAHAFGCDKRAFTEEEYNKLKKVLIWELEGEDWIEYER